jgi:hypothetical protein
MATGYEQVRSVVAALAGDFAAADDVQLELPETGVCNTRSFAPAGAAAGAACCGPAPAEPVAAAGGCCGGPAPKGEAACCLLDSQAKAAGAAGCGCSSTKDAVAA